MKAFDNFAAVLAAATLGLLFLSVCHEYGYFWIVGSRFQTFLSTTDYFSNAILWLPVLTFLLYSYLDWGVMLGNKKYNFGKNWKWKLAFWSVTLGFPVFAFFDFKESFAFTYALPIIFVWVGFVAGNLPYANTRSEVLRMAHRAMVIGPVVAVIAFSAGVMQAESALASFSEPYRLDLKAGIRLNRTLLRTFDKGVLVRDPSADRIEFIRWDDLLSLSRLAPTIRKEPFSCSWFKINCSQPTTIP